MKRRILVSIACLIFASCGDSKTKRSVEKTCGNAVLNAPELCDPLIVVGDGACPVACESQSACAVGRLEGSAATCDAQCVNYVIDECVNDDGCCPAGCGEEDSDCSQTCGDGKVDPGETCDGDCQSCDDNDVCTSDLETGSAENCSLECIHDSILTCVDGDGCCPSACDEANDSDCSMACGDGVVVAGEVCDGNCPTSCDDNNLCTKDALSGSPDLCNVVCINDPITACQSDDGCCATGCNSENDNDCVCEPITCNANICGDIDDGCGGTAQCGACGAGKICDNNACIVFTPGALGDACQTDQECAGANICANSADFKDGFCTSLCSDDFGCAQGSHCMFIPNYNTGACSQNCVADNDCRSDGYRCHDIDNSGNTECAPKGIGNSPIGGACAGLYECNGDAESCVQGTDFPGGYCTYECSFNGECFGNSICVNSLCTSKCVTNADCRTGYTCESVTGTFGEVENICFGRELP